MSSRLGVLLLIGLLIVISARSSFAFRPLRTEDAGTNSPGVLGLELGNQFTNTSDGRRNADTITLTYGLTKWIEADINFIFRTLIPDSGETEFGFGDTILAGKFRVIDERKILPAFLIEPSVSLPTGSASKGTGSGETELGLLLVLEKTVGKLTGRANLGYFATNLDEDYKDRIFYAFELDFPISKKLTLASEVTGDTNSKGEGGPVFALAGLLFKITKSAVFDGAVEFGLNNESRSAITVIYGVTFTFFGK